MTSRVLVGINNRNLETFETDLGISETLAHRLPTGTPIVAESGINDRCDIERLMKSQINIFLIGEALLKADDIGRKLKELL